MHDTAYLSANLFFRNYWKSSFETIIELGSQDVNGSLRDFAPAGVNYIGVDIEAGKGVDLVVAPNVKLPFPNQYADIVIASSVLEHDPFFWETFCEMARITRDDGFIYVSAPSNGEVHRYPADYWRFYPDAAKSLCEVARRNGTPVTLIESFVMARQQDQWNDYVAVFARGEISSARPLMFLHENIVAENVWKVGSENLLNPTTLTEDQRLLRANNTMLARANDARFKIEAEIDNTSQNGQSPLRYVEGSAPSQTSDELGSIICWLEQEVISFSERERLMRAREHFFQLRDYVNSQSHLAKQFAMINFTQRSVFYNDFNGEILAGSPLFDADYYTSTNIDLRNTNVNAVSHYMTFGYMENRSTHPLVMISFIEATWPKHLNKNFNLLLYLSDKSQWPLSVHPLFDASYYLAQYHGEDNITENPLVHYLTHGWREGKNPSALFDGNWYLFSNSDVFSAGVNPLVHYITYGSAEGRRPSPLFDPKYYLAIYPDVLASGIEAYVHYILHGRNEGRLVSEDVNKEMIALALSSETSKISLLEVVGSFGDAFALPDLISAMLAFNNRYHSKLWPPKSDQGFWMPQVLRGHLIEEYGIRKLWLYEYLFSVVSRYDADHVDFLKSNDCAAIADRLNLLASMRSSGEFCVSVVIPIYNNVIDTLICLASVLEAETSVSYEVLIGDDGSDEIMRSLFDSIGGNVRLIHHEENSGFLLNCNFTAGYSRAEYLVFLNNDTVVLPGWLDNILAPLLLDKTVGLVGSKLLNWDGTLQEAGGIFWNDGSALNFGRDGDPEAPEFNYRKEVDYCSGASMAISRDLWEELGGFDPLFQPAYCEDADLAFRVRAKGKRVIYEPRSVVVHHEGRSHGRDTTKGVKAYQTGNLKKFFRRWKDVLSEGHFPAGQNILEARDRSASKPHIVVIDRHVPRWDQDAGSRSMYHYVKILVDLGFQVTLWPDDLESDFRYTIELEALGIEVMYSKQKKWNFEDWFAARADLVTYVVLSRPEVAIRYMPLIKKHENTRVVYFGHDFHFMRMQNGGSDAEDKSAWHAQVERMRLLELHIWQQSDVIVYFSVEEVEYVRAAVSEENNVKLLPIFVFDDIEIAAGRKRVDSIRNLDDSAVNLLFVGGFSHSPNIDAVIWFATRVMPLLRQTGRNVSLEIVGSNPPRNVLELAAADVVIRGRLSDDQLDASYASAAVAIVPLRYGAGLKGKVIEAMAKGVPVIMTDVGAQGIPDSAKLGYRGDDPASFADAVMQAIQFRSEARERAQRAIDYIDEFYSRRAVSRALKDIMPDLIL